MLYVTTRNDRDVYTCSWALRNDLASDGGLYVPYLLPVLDDSQLNSVKRMRFGEAVSFALNLLFSCKTCESDIDLLAGKNPVKYVQMSHKILVAEIWHNPDNVFSYMEELLHQLVCGAGITDARPSQWSKIAIRISVLFGIFAKTLSYLTDEDDRTIDIAVDFGDFIMPMAVWYARKMGLPIRMIVCTSKENSILWDLVLKGELNTGIVTRKRDELGNANSLLVSIERLLFDTFGVAEIQNYIDICQKKGTYYLDENMLSRINTMIYPVVIGADRIDRITKNVNHTHGYLLDTSTAIAYAGLQDYRASVGESHLTLLLSERSAT